MTDREIMQRFVDTTEAIGEVKTAVARIETKVDALVAAQARCTDHATRLKEAEKSITKIEHDRSIAGWLIGLAFAIVGAIASMAAFFRGE
jgi:hypothetical protein